MIRFVYACSTRTGHFAWALTLFFGCTGCKCTVETSTTTTTDAGPAASAKSERTPDDSRVRKVGIIPDAHEILAFAGDDIYAVSDRKRILSLPKRGGEPEVVTTFNEDTPVAVEGDVVYFVEGNRVKKRPLRGSDATLLATEDIIGASNLTVTPNSIIVATSNTIVRLSKDAAKAPQIVHIGDASPPFVDGEAIWFYGANMHETPEEMVITRRVDDRTFQLTYAPMPSTRHSDRIVSDSEHVYWSDGIGLWRYPKANAAAEDPEPLPAEKVFEGKVWGLSMQGNVLIFCKEDGIYRNSWFNDPVKIADIAAQATSVSDGTLYAVDKDGAIWAIAGAFDRALGE